MKWKLEGKGEDNKCTLNFSGNPERKNSLGRRRKRENGKYY